MRKIITAILLALVPMLLFANTKNPPTNKQVEKLAYEQVKKTMEGRLSDDAYMKKGKDFYAKLKDFHVSGKTEDLIYHGKAIRYFYYDPDEDGNYKIRKQTFDILVMFDDDSYTDLEIRWGNQKYEDIDEE